ncbi:MAG TPA: hypothetical protein VGQ30_09680 [Gemmatimonadaceae bacterium]|jgi:hypothetical protein|nr:hypothetical protein [Gemmatimonadaceae bacterium]
MTSRRPNKSLAIFAVALALSAPVAARAQIAVLSSTVEEKTAGPGEKYTGTIVVANSSSTPQAARIYQTDYRFAFDGTAHYDDPGTTPRSNASWISTQLSRVVIPPNSQVSVPYSVAVPTGDSLRGTYWSLMMVEGTPVEPPAANGAKPAVSLGAVMRYAVQLATHIRNTGTRTVEFSAPQATKAANGTALLDVNMTDTGERAFRPTLWVEVYDAQGVLKGKGKQTRGLLYPGTSLHQHFELGVLPPGTYKAVIFADTGEDSVFATQFVINY